MDYPQGPQVVNLVQDIEAEPHKSTNAKLLVRLLIAIGIDNAVVLTPFILGSRTGWLLLYHYGFS